MSDREKKLLTLFATAMIIIAGFFLVKIYFKKKDEFINKKIAAQGTLDLAKQSETRHAELQDEIEWLAKYEPKEKDPSLVPSDLQKFVEQTATSSGLTIVKQGIIDGSHDNVDPAERAGVLYEAARVQITVSGKEQALYQWLDKCHIPNESRIIGSLNLKPNRDDDTLIDCTTVIEQWYAPKRPIN